jgi:hypothetical protein
LAQGFRSGQEIMHLDNDTNRLFEHNDELFDIFIDIGVHPKVERGCF